MQPAGQITDTWDCGTPRLVQLDVEPEPLEERVPGDLLALVGGRGGGGVGQRPAGEVGARGVPVGGEVGERVVVTRAGPR